MREACGQIALPTWHGVETAQDRFSRHPGAPPYHPGAFFATSRGLHGASFALCLLGPHELAMFPASLPNARGVQTLMYSSKGKVEYSSRSAVYCKSYVVGRLGTELLKYAMFVFESFASRSASEVACSGEAYLAASVAAIAVRGKRLFADPTRQGSRPGGGMCHAGASPVGVYGTGQGSRIAMPQVVERSSIAYIIRSGRELRKACR